MITRLDRLQGRDIYENTALAKINEIIDLLNAIVVDVDGIKCIDGSKKAEPADPYAEQRKWIGKLCRFRDVCDSKWQYRILESINNTIPNHPFWDAEGYEWEICEPVEPDDYVIYKGE